MIDCRKWSSRFRLGTRRRSNIIFICVRNHTLISQVLVNCFQLLLFIILLLLSHLLYILNSYNEVLSDLTAPLKHSLPEFVQRHRRYLFDNAIRVKLNTPSLLLKFIYCARVVALTSFGLVAGTDMVIARGVWVSTTWSHLLSLDTSRHIFWSATSILKPLILLRLAIAGVSGRMVVTSGTVLLILRYLIMASSV